ncbi:hypothetical protein QBC39DRAFT_358150 [Podospora conica]|nr:hypothetical protein QBC39DRAFT_358150 [Schizothecium conicum]
MSPTTPGAVTLASMSEYDDEDAAYLRQRPEAEWTQLERTMLSRYEAKKAKAATALTTAPRPRRPARRAPSIVSASSRAISALRREGVVSQFSSLVGGQARTTTSVLAQGLGPGQESAMQRTELHWRRADHDVPFPADASESFASPRRPPRERALPTLPTFPPFPDPETEDVETEEVHQSPSELKARLGRLDQEITQQREAQRRILTDAIEIEIRLRELFFDRVSVSCLLEGARPGRAGIGRGDMDAEHEGQDEVQDEEQEQGQREDGGGAGLGMY